MNDLGLELVSTVCEDCHTFVESTAVRDASGLLHPLPLSPEQLVTHAHCDLWKLLRAVALAAFHQSRVTTFSIVRSPSSDSAGEARA